MLRLVINLDRSIKRWQHMAPQFQTLGITVQRVSAVDASSGKLPLDKIAPLGSPEKYFYPRKLTSGAIACYLSHIKCWEMLLESKEQWAVISEDDVIFSQKAKDFFLSSDWIPPGVHVFQVHTISKHWQCKTFTKPLAVTGGFNLYRIIEPTFGTCCYLIDREAAQVALNLSQTLASPVDEFLFNFKSPFTQKFPSMRLNPTLALHDNYVPSTVVCEGLSSASSRYSIRSHLSPRRLYLSAKKRFLKSFFSVDTDFTWE